MESGQTYHIYNHANGTENLFREDENYRYFLQQYNTYLAEVVDTFAYCLMPNHFHLLVKVKAVEELKDLSGFENLTGLDAISNGVSKHFSNFFNSYAKAINKKYNRRGSLFERAFKRKPIESDQQWQETFLYIHLNPIKHSFTQNINSWKWSSWHAYSFPDKSSQLNRQEAMVYFDHFEHIQKCINDKRDLIMRLDME